MKNVIVILCAFITFANLCVAQVPVEEETVAPVEAEEAVDVESTEVYDKSDIEPDTAEYPKPAVRGGKVGWVSSKDSNKVIIPFEYDDAIGWCHYWDAGGSNYSISPYSTFELGDDFYCGPVVLPCWVKKNGKYGMIDSIGKILIPFEYDYVGDYFDYYSDDANRGSEFNTGYRFPNSVGVWKNGKVGMYSLVNDKIVIPCIYDTIFYGWTAPNECICVKNGKYCMWRDVLFTDTLWYDLEFFGHSKWVQVLPCVFDELGTVSAISYEDGGAIVEKEIQEEKISKIRKKTVLQEKMESLYLKGKKDGKMFYYDHQMRDVTNNVPDWVVDIVRYRDFFVLKNKSGKWNNMYEGTIDKMEYDKATEPIMIYCHYKTYGGSEQIGLYYAIRNGKKGIINSSFKWITPINSDSMEVVYPKIDESYWSSFPEFDFSKSLVAYTTKDNHYSLWGVVNHNGKEVLPCKYKRSDFELLDDVWMDSGGNEIKPNLKVRNNGKWGVVNSEGKYIIPCEYDKINSLEDGCFELVKGKKRTKVNAEGKPCK